MSKTWVTKTRDLLLAEEIMSQYKEMNQTGLALFELVVDLSEKKMTYEVSPWVIELATQFKSLYGEEQGEHITRKIISDCIRDNHSVH
ncbi:MAG: hypothetical protein NTW08_02950 [Gammaproteobacteria bacterium]|nr:hypothetical protein [Gammaproteobacteria bacterium]